MSTKDESSKKNKRAKAYLYTMIFGTVVMIASFIFGFWYPADSNSIKFHPRKIEVVTEKEAGAPPLSRSNFKTTPDQINSLQKSIPATNNIQAFNGAYLSHDNVATINSGINRFRDLSYKTSFVIMNLKTGKGIAYNTNELFYSASAIKAPYIASLLSGDSLIEDMDSNKALAWDVENILTWSDNDSYLDLDYRYDTYAFQGWADKANLDNKLEIGHAYMDFTCADLAKMWLQIYSDHTQGYIDDEIAELAQNPQVSSIHSVLGESAQTWSKAGWIPGIDGLSATNDAGIVKTKDSVYLIAICSDAPSDFELLDNMVYILSSLEPTLI